MRIVIIGGHGKVALLATPLLKAAGHEVSSWIRNPAHADEVATAGAVPSVVDVEQLDVSDLTELLVGKDAVLWSAGAGGGDPARTDAVDRDAAIRSIDAAAAAGVGRYVMVSYFGAGPDHGVAPDNSFYVYAEAKAAADTHLAATELAWTILGPSGLTDEPGTGMIEAGEDVTASTVSRADVAGVIAAVIDQPATAGSVINFNCGSTPISNVVAAFAR